jgi:formylglycine-generating enzyme required for sulfatase activity
VGSAVFSSTIGLSVGDRLGPYVLAAVIGEGGFGVVFRAEQEAPIRRTVALKILKHSVHFRQVISRFEAERHTLARMDHPHIARVLDSGQTPDGRLYFVMEYVEGQPLTRYCRERSLSVFGRVQLFHAVCLAVAHAHQKGVIHRDLKPTNILVTEVDGKPVPKVIDFGVAKATLEEDEPRSLMTLEGQLVGTPQYMSPEQAAGERDLDTRSDVYSLGVVLYELIVGQPPFDSERSGLQQLLRAIQWEDPIRPSRAVRSAEARSAKSRIGRDLDAVILRCLEKEPARRYPTVAALAVDVDLFLHGRPVEAVAPSTWYRAWKLARRHRAASTSLALLLVVVVAAVIANLMALKEARLQGRIAGENAQHAIEQEKLATQRASELAVATKTAQENEKRAREEEQLATRKANDVLSLSAIQELRELEDEADKLWPAHPENVAKYNAWLTKAKLLIEGRAKDEGPGMPMHPSIADHETKLAEIRKRGRPHPREPSELDGKPSTGDDASDARDVTYEFDDAQDRWWHTQLAELVADLKAFTNEKKGGLYSAGISEQHGWGILKRAEFARTIEGRSVSGPDAKRRWDEAVAAIAKSSKYGGLELTPEIGLLPIGEDPDSHLWEFAHLQTGDVAQRGAGGKLVLDERMGLVLVLLPGGKFWMGAQKTDPTIPNYDPQAEDNEMPVHEVELSPFFLSKYEMTQGQWERFVGKNPSFFLAFNFSTDWSRHGRAWSALKPVEQVSWTDCMSVMERLGLTLPSEAQWEHGCRAGQGSVYWCGDAKESLAEAGNVADAYAKAHGGQTWSVLHEAWDDGNSMTAEVGSYRPNAFGLHDVHGNVWEWCLDGYDSESYVHSPKLDPIALLRGAAGRVGRGGSFSLAASFARSAFRTGGTPGSRSNDLGLRPAMTLSAPASQSSR